MSEKTERKNIKVTTGPDPLRRIDDNCGEKKAEIQRDYDEAVFGTCFHPTALDAEVYATTVLLERLAETGAVFNVNAGSKTVNRSVNGVPLPNTFLSYAAGDYSPKA